MKNLKLDLRVNNLEGMMRMMKMRVEQSVNEEKIERK